MLLSVVLPWETPDKSGIWVAVSVILNPLSIQRAHGAVMIPGVFRFVISTANVNLTADTKKRRENIATLLSKVLPGFSRVLCFV